jgi:hypothetical protein
MPTGTADPILIPPDANHPTWHRDAIEFDADHVFLGLLGRERDTEPGLALGLHIIWHIPPANTDNDFHVAGTGFCGVNCESAGAANLEKKPKNV